MTTLKQQSETDLDMFMETGLPWIDQATFTPQTGAPVSLNVIFEQEQHTEPDDFETRTSGMTYTVEALISDIGQVPVTATSTRPGDFFTINNIVYEVTGIASLDNDFVTCTLRIKS